MSRIDECQPCQRPFYVSEIGAGMPGTKEREDIPCPYCDHTTTEISNGVFSTSKLSAPVEAAWKAVCDAQSGTTSP